MMIGDDENLHRTNLIYYNIATKRQNNIKRDLSEGRMLNKFRLFIVCLYFAYLL